MNKRTNIILIVVIIILAIALAVGVKLFDKKDKDNNNDSQLGKIESAQDLQNLMDKVYEGISKESQPMLETTIIDPKQDDMVNMLTGLENGNELDYLVVSQPLMNAQAYSVVLAKVKEGADSSQIAKTMFENVDTRRWICVEAEKLYVTNSGDVVCLVMADSESAKAVYENFKKKAGTVGKEYEKTAEPEELPADMY